jgi:hypothetical protein
MNGCYDEGTLRAQLDGELPAQTRAAVRDHLAGCRSCAARLEELRVAASRAGALLAAPQPDTRAALGAMRASLRRTEETLEQDKQQRSQPMTIQRTWSRRIAYLAVAAVAAVLLALPPVQAAADQLLKIFRVQSVVFVPIDGDRMRELEQLNFDGTTLFVAEPKLVNDPGEPQTVATADEAAALVGYPVVQPALSAQPTSVEYVVRGRSVHEFQVNVESARQLLQVAGVTDVTLPDALGSAPITADVPPAVVTSYRGDGYELNLVQGRSPEVSLPDGVDLQQLGTAMLRLLGSSPEQAAALSSQIDWSTTFVFPFPADMDGVQTVQYGDVTALQVTSRNRGEQQVQLYWQRGERFFVLNAEGAVDDAALQAVVDSTR